MNRIIIFMAMALCLSSCAAMKNIPVANESTQKDTVFIKQVEHDSIYVDNKIFIKEKGDTVIIYKEKYKYQTQFVHDTLYRSHTDTLVINNPPEIVEIEKPLKWYQKFMIWCGRIAFGLLILWLLRLVLKLTLKK